MIHRTSLVILEGPDGAGKSTLAGSQIFMGTTKVHTGPPKTESPFHEYMGVIHDNLDGPLKKPMLIFDRFHLGEHVYGPILRGKSRLSLSQSHLIDDRLMEERAVLVICLPPLEAIKANVNLTDGSQLPRTTNHLEQIYAGYERLCERTALETLFYDYTAEDAYSLYTRINAAWDEQ